MNGFKKMISCFITHRRYFILEIVFLIASNLFNHAIAQQKDSVIIKGDSTIVITEQKKDSTINGVAKDTVVKKKKVYVPRKAALYSAVLPGLGQVYNRKYWKVPVVHAALGVTAYIFFDNLKTYKDYRFIYSAKYKASVPGATATDSADYYTLTPILQEANINAVKSYRDETRRNIDYSVLVFVLFWGLNVVDATVDAHLKSFDVSPDLTLKFKAGHSEMAGTNGVSLILKFRDKHGR